MIKTAVSAEGMACGMCLAHINDAIRAAIPVKKAASPHTKRETVILSDARPYREAVKRAITGAGCTLFSVTAEAA